MKKLLSIIVLGLLLSTSYSFAEFRFIEKGKLKVGTTQKKLKKMLDWTLPTNNIVLVPSWDKKFNIVSLKITPARYDFEYYPREGMPMKFIISINRLFNSNNF